MYYTKQMTTGLLKDVLENQQSTLSIAISEFNLVYNQEIQPPGKIGKHRKGGMRRQIRSSVASHRSTFSCTRESLPEDLLSLLSFKDPAFALLPNSRVIQGSIDSLFSLKLSDGIKQTLVLQSRATLSANAL